MVWRGRFHLTWHDNLKITRLPRSYSTSMSENEMHGNDCEKDNESGYSYYKTTVSNLRLDGTKSTSIPSKISNESMNIKEKLDIQADDEVVTEVPKKSIWTAKNAGLRKFLSDSDMQKISQKNQEIADQMLKSDFKRVILPRISFLLSLGLEKSEIGPVFCRHPPLAYNEINKMQGRVDYLRSKKFSDDSIAKIIKTAPGILRKSLRQIDKIMGSFQREFDLNGDEVREVVTKCPKLVLYDSFLIKGVILTLQQLGFNDEERKQIMLTHPRLYIQRRDGISERFHYLHSLMGVEHSAIAEWSKVLRTSVACLKVRHVFLQSLGKDQFDTSKPDFVSMEAFSAGRDVDFCNGAAKVSLDQFVEFKKKFDWNS